MSQLEKTRSALSMAENEELPQYRKLSLLAVGAFVLGLASPLALLNPVLWVVPVVGALTACLGIRATLVGDPPLAGRALAVVGLLLAMCFAGWAPARYVTREQKIKEQAQAFGNHWFEMVQARQVKELHQLSRRPVDRREPGVSLEDAYNVKPEEHGATGEEALLMSLQMSPQTLLNQYIEIHPLKDLLAQAERGELSLAWKDPAPDPTKAHAVIAFERVDEVLRISNTLDQVKLIYQWRTHDGERPRTQRLRITVKRHLAGDAGAW
jgi:hypothetical protein